MHFTLAVAMTQPEHYTALARTAEASGFHQIAVPDSIFWSEQVSTEYPYTPDGTAALGVTDIVTIPWLFQGVPIDGPLDAKQDGIRQFQTDVIDAW